MLSENQHKGGFRMDFAERVKFFRKKKGISQSQMAKDLEINNSTISKWEKGVYTPELHMVMKLCKYFGITLDQLVGEQQELTTINMIDLADVLGALKRREVYWGRSLMEEKDQLFLAQVIESYMKSKEEDHKNEQSNIS